MSGTWAPINLLVLTVVVVIMMTPVARLGESWMSVSGQRALLLLRRRNLHARHAKGAATLLLPDCLHLSPVHGLLIYGSPALGSLWAEGADDGPPVARLARALFNRHEPEEPLVPARNKSLPAVYLTPELQGHCLGLALRDASGGEVRSSLYGLGVDAIARESGVSIARFERLVGLMREAVRTTHPLHDSTGGSVVLAGTSVVLAFVWATAPNKRSLLDFLMALRPHLEEQESRLFTPEASPHCSEWLSSFEEPFGKEVTYMLGGGSRSVAPSDTELEALCDGHWIPPAALERLAFQLVERSGCAPEIPQQVYGYRGQPPMADCVEACAREALGFALWDGNGHDTSRLPPSSDPRMLDYFGGGVCDGMESGQAWYDLVSARPGLEYMLGTSPDEEYELSPSVDNFAATLSSLLRVDVATPPEGGGMCSVWAGSQLQWQRAGTARHPELLLRQAADVTADVASDHREMRIDPDPGPGPDPNKGEEFKSSRVESSRVKHEEMRIVFNGARHCYSTRDATTTEPAWVGRVRLAWRKKLPEAPAAAAAAARLLGLCGPVLIARHEALHREAEERDSQLAAAAARHCHSLSYGRTELVDRGTSDTGAGVRRGGRGPVL